MRVTRVATSLTMGILIGIVVSFAGAAAATDAAAETLQVSMAPAEPGGPQGLAILSSVDAATTVQVLVTGAPEGAIATLHPGTCSQLEDGVVGLVGQLSTTGQAQATVPVPFTTIADGDHVIALHASLDLGSPVACGAIPAARAAGSPGAEPAASTGAQASPPTPPEPDPQPAPTPVVVATMDPGCLGIPEWLVATRARLEQLAEGERELNRLANDAAAYQAALGEQIGRINVMIAEMRQEAVPATAASVHQQLAGALESGVTAARDLIQSFAVSDPALYQQSIRMATDAARVIGEVRVAVGELDARCTPAPAS